MKERFFEITDKEIKVYDAETTISEMAWETLVNFFWGFTANFMTPFIAAKIDAGVLISMGMYYMIISIVLNRKPYTTKLGRYIIMPLPAVAGAFASYKAGYAIIALIK
jgi:hypothetical protein